MVDDHTAICFMIKNEKNKIVAFSLKQIKENIIVDVNFACQFILLTQWLITKKETEAITNFSKNNFINLVIQSFLYFVENF